MVQSSTSWNVVDVTNNEITAAANEPYYIKNLKDKLSRKRLVTDIDAEEVGALGVCMSLSNEYPSWTGV